MSRAALGQAKAARTDFGDMAITITSTAILSPAILPAQAPDQIEVFIERCEARALLFINGAFELHDAVDELQAAAERTGLVDRIGQDQVQAMMGAAFAAVRKSPRELVVPDRSYQTPTATIDAFFYVVSLNDPDRLKAWLQQHPGDAPTLLRLLERK
jgi:hypothetical protein